MRYPELVRLRDFPYFTTEDVANILDIKPTSAIVLCARYAERGLFIRLKKNLYVLRDRWQQNSYRDFYKISNILHVPSYISFMTALSFYEVTTQVQRDFLESACIKKTVSYEIEGISFNFYKLKKERYLDFVKMDDFFIATKEKAFLDTIYLYSLGRYAFDLDSLDLRKIDFKKLKTILNRFPEKTKRLVKEICRP
jgi:predicted transcriptional regulator of viral defense system